MSKAFFKQYEAIHGSDRIQLQNSNLRQLLDQLTFDAAGLICVTTQCVKSGEVLMQAWMNRASIEQTLKTSRVTYWSRSRQAIWVKGESSGHVQHLKSMRVDCDGDAILCLVEQVGPACHTGRLSCFYLEVNSKSDQVQYCPPYFGKTAQDGIST